MTEPSLPPWAAVLRWPSSTRGSWDWTWDCLCTAHFVYDDPEEARREGHEHAVSCVKGRRRFEEGWPRPSTWDAYLWDGISGFVAPPEEGAEEAWAAFEAGTPLIVNPQEEP